jgi:hypothetical protein
MLLAGSPDFPAFERAVQKAFGSAATTATTPAVARRTSVISDRDSLAPDDPDTSTADADTVRTATDAVVATPTQRPRGVLLPLYASFAALQALDAHSTLRALDAGATEANPLMGGLTRTPAALLAVKAGMAASTIYLVEKVRIKSRGAAIALMAALNSLYATIVAHNYRVP